MRWPFGDRELAELRDLAAQYRKTFEDSRRLVVTSSNAGYEWASWAVQTAYANEGSKHDFAVAQAAEAFWQLASEIPHSMRRRHDVKRQRELALSQQGVASQAAYWLARAGRIEDAVVAAELTRAIALSQTALALTSDVTERLRSAGRLDLMDAYGAALRGYRDVENYAYANAAPPPLRGLTRLTPGQEAWTRLQHAEVDIQDALGVQAESLMPTYKDLREQADGTAVIYAVASPAGGYALVLPADQHRPAESIALPDLTEDRVEGWYSSFQQLVGRKRPPSPASRWSALLGELGRAVMQPALGRLAKGQAVVLIPLGVLGMLPLHAAYLDDDVVVDRHAIRYAPNLRMLGQAHRSAKLADRQGSWADVNSLMLVEPGRVAGLPDLPWTRIEAQAVKNLYRPHVRLPQQSTPAAVLKAMNDTTIWHLACHGSSDPVNPLRSHLALQGGPLTLTDLLVRPSERHRLAVLSACQTSIPDVDRLDEVISFPGALLRVGVAGVLATQWTTDDEATALLTIRFHSLCLRGEPPWAALCQAQRELRRATRRELLDWVGEQQQRAYLDEHGIDQPPEEWLDEQPFEAPALWAPFTYTGA